MYTIGQMAKLVGVTRDTLKFYEEKDLLNPKQDKENGYRIYDHLDMHDIMTVNFYREIDVEIKEIQKIKESHSMEYIEEVLANKETKLKEEIKHRKLLLQKVKQIQEDCKNIKENINKFTIKEMKPIEVISRINSENLIEEYCNVDASSRGIKGTVTLTGLTRILTFESAGITNSEYIAMRKLNGDEVDVKGEIISHPKCLYTIIEDNVIEEDAGKENNIGDTIINAAEELGCKLTGISYINMIVNGYDDSRSRIYLEIYNPIE